MAGNIGLFEHTDPNVMTMTIFAPVIDSVDVLDHPWARAQAGQHFNGPLLLGTTRDEGASFCGTAQNLTQPEFEAFALQAYPGVDMSTVLQLYSDSRPPPPPAAATTAAATAGSEWWWASAKLSGDIGFHCGSRAGAPVGSPLGRGRARHRKSVPPHGGLELLSLEPKWLRHNTVVRQNRAVAYTNWRFWCSALL